MGDDSVVWPYSAAPDALLVLGCVGVAAPVAVLDASGFHYQDGGQDTAGDDVADAHV